MPPKKKPGFCSIACFGCAALFLFSVLIGGLHRMMESPAERDREDAEYAAQQKKQEADQAAERAAEVRNRRKEQADAQLAEVMKELTDDETLSAGSSENAETQVTQGLDKMSGVFAEDRITRARALLFVYNKLEEYGKPERPSTIAVILCEAVPQKMHRRMKLAEVSAAILTLVHPGDQ